MGPVGEERIGQAGWNGKERAADGAEDRGDDEGGETIAADVDPGELGLAGVLADRAQAEAERRADDPPHDDRAEDEHGE